jgi:hypothetical protein
MGGRRDQLLYLHQTGLDSDTAIHERQVVLLHLFCFAAGVRSQCNAAGSVHSAGWASAFPA